MIKFMLENSGQPAFGVHREGVTLGIEPAQDDIGSSAKGIAKIWHGKASLYFAFFIQWPTLSLPQAQNGIHNGPLVESVLLITPLPDKNLNINPDLGRCEAHPWRFAHRVDHV